MNSEQYQIEDVVKADKSYLWHHLKPHRLFDKEQMIVAKANGIMIEDIHGREYLDATSGGVWSVLVGYGRESIAKAVYEQLNSLAYFAGSYGNIPTIKFAEKLLTKLPRMDKVYFANSGSEANEKVFKLVRQASKISPTRQGKYKILYRDRDYHGSTIATISATGQNERRDDYGPFVEGFVEFDHCCCYRCPYNKTYPSCNIECASKVEEVIKREGPETVGAMIVEPITAGGGVIPPVPEYYPMLQAICKKYDIWLIMDEVVCGFGRTGKFWGHEHYDVDPDIVTMAKGMASSYQPLSAVAVKQAVYDVFLNDLSKPDERLNYFRDISTYGGCTGSLAAALENLRIIEDEDLVEKSRETGDYLLQSLEELQDLPIVGNVRGKGLFCGLEFVTDRAKKTPISEQTMSQIMGSLLSDGFIVGRTNSSFTGLNNVMNFAPSLIITKDQVDQLVAAVRRTLEKV